ncbi:hypothetical protein CIB48_g1841 [Xylaria polymorpha]|nr:hypothetical protein CIB48_g1841 [Xylaria polymorpha]
MHHDLEMTAERSNIGEATEQGLNSQSVVLSEQTTSFGIEHRSYDEFDSRRQSRRMGKTGVAVAVHEQGGIADTVGEEVVSCEYGKRLSNHRVDDQHVDGAPNAIARLSAPHRRQGNGVRVGSGAYAPRMNMPVGKVQPAGEASRIWQSSREAQQQLLRHDANKPTKGRGTARQTKRFVCEHPCSYNCHNNKDGSQLSDDLETLGKDGVNLNGTDFVELH